MDSAISSLNITETTDVVTVQQVSALRELSALELALVGGGGASVEYA
jgi:hypothetical protein